MPSIVSAFIAFSVVLLLLGLFRVKNPQIKIYLLLIPLMRSFFVFTSGIPVSKFGSEGKISIGFRIPDPFGFVPKNLDTVHWSSFFYNLDMITIITFMVISVVVALLFYRWIALYIFYRNLMRHERITASDCPVLFKTLDELVPKFGTKYPSIILTHEDIAVPFTLGIFKPVMVLSPEMLERIEVKHIEMILAHELAHIKRRDYFTHWLNLIVKDIMFFNPVVWIIYDQIEEEREKACDRLCLGIVRKKEHLVEAISKVYSMIKPFESKIKSPVYSALLGNEKKILVRLGEIERFEKHQKISTRLIIAILILAIPQLTISIHGSPLIFSL